MDILISSNLERFLYELSGRDAGTVASRMKQLKSENFYELSPEMRRGMEDFYGGFADDAETVRAIGDLYREHGYLVDTHTAVAYRVYRRYIDESGDERPALIASTASPFKFARSVAEGIGIETGGKSDFELIDFLSAHTGLEVPEPIRGLADRPVRHPGSCTKEEMRGKVEEILR